MVKYWVTKYTNQKWCYLEPVLYCWICTAFRNHSSGIRTFWLPACISWSESWKIFHCVIIYSPDKSTAMLRRKYKHRVAPSENLRCIPSNRSITLYDWYYCFNLIKLPFMQMFLHFYRGWGCSHFSYSKQQLIVIHVIWQVNMSIAILPMSADFNWNPATVGLIQSSFFWGYLLTQVGKICITKYQIFILSVILTVNSYTPCLPFFYLHWMQKLMFV